jgi:hypothetical protein
MISRSYNENTQAKSRPPMSKSQEQYCGSNDALIAVSVVNARKCDGDDRARRDTTCHGCALLLSLPLTGLTIMPRTVRYRASRRPAVWPPFCSIPFRPTSSRLRMSCACFLPSTMYSLVPQRIYYAQEYISVVSRRPVSDLKVSFINALSTLSFSA